MQIFIRRNNDQRGPFDLFTIQQGLDSGKILPTDSAWYEGAPGWVFVSQLPGIKTNLPAVPPPHPDDYKTRRIGDAPTVHLGNAASVPSPAPIPYPTAPQSVPVQGHAPQAATFQPASVGCLPMFGAFIAVFAAYFFLLFILFATLPEETASALVWIFHLGSIAWVGFDSHALKTDRGQVTGAVNMPPWAWIVSCIILWAIAFPIYLVTRHEIKRVNDLYPTGIPITGANNAKTNGTLIVGIGCLVTVLITLIVIAVLTVLGNQIQNTFNAVPPPT